MSSIQEVLSRLESYRSLPVGWSSPAVVAMPAQVVDRAIGVVKAFAQGKGASADKAVVSACASADGKIYLRFGGGTKELQIDIEDGTDVIRVFCREVVQWDRPIEDFNAPSEIMSHEKLGLWLHWILKETEEVG